MQFSIITTSILSLLITISLANPVPEPETFGPTLHQASEIRDAEPEPHLMARVACSSTACKTLLNEASCIFDSTKNPIKLVQCLSKAGGVSSVSDISRPKAMLTM